MIIKVTGIHNPYLTASLDQSRDLYVNVDHIETMWQNADPAATVLTMASGRSYWVRETPEQIVNM